MKSIKKFVTYGFPAILLVAPVFALAQGEGAPGLISKLGGIIQSLIPIVIGLALLIFLWGVLSYVVAKDDETKKTARGVMVYGVIALFVMVAVWGLVNLLGETLRLNYTPPPPPGFPTR